MKVPKRRLAAVFGIGLAAALIGSGVANADPTVPVGGNAYDRPLQGQGSDTTEAVMNALSEVALSNGNPIIASWDAKGTTGFTTRSPGNTPGGSNCTYQGNPTPDAAAYAQGFRANGSGNGQKALKDAFTAGQSTFGCLDFSRSSSSPSASNVGTVPVYGIPLATDGLTYVRTAGGLAPKQLTKAQLQGAYHCTFGNFKNNSNPASATNFKALLPQAGSGTRKDWMTLVGISETDLTNGLYPCVTDQTDFGTRGGPNPVQEHDSRSVNNFSIAPVSIAQWIAQKGGTMVDVQGNAVLGGIKSTTADPVISYPIQLNSGYGAVGGGDSVAATRTVYNVVPKALLDAGGSQNANAVLAFIDTNVDPNVNSALVCNDAVLRKFGFTPVSTCGTTAISVN